MSLLEETTRFIIADIQNNWLRAFFDILLVGVILFVIFRKPYDPKKENQDKLTEEEVDELCQEWKPEPLVPSKTYLPSRHVTQSSPGPTLAVSIDPTLTGNTRSTSTVLNFATFNFLGFSNHPRIIQHCKEVIDNYGVGACGPRGFYGSIKPHIDLEKKAFEFFKTEDCILYSYGFATISSVIPAFAKRSDMVIVDEGCSYPIQHGVELSRATKKLFRHNDMEDLERVLKEITTGVMGAQHTKQLRFIVIQGVYENTGDVAPLKRIVELKNKYKVRIIMDDSFGAGVLGPTGRGTVEHFGIDPEDIEILVVNLENALGGVGGLCLGSKKVVRHQRLMGLAFTFSASLPPYTAAAAEYAMNMIEEDPQLPERLREKIRCMQHELRDHLHPKLQIHTTLNSPILHIRLRDDFVSGSNSFELQTKLLDRIRDKCLMRGVALVVPRFSNKEWRPIQPSIRITVSISHEKSQIIQCARVLREACDDVLESTDPTRAFNEINSRVS